MTSSQLLGPVPYHIFCFINGQHLLKGRWKRLIYHITTILLDVINTDMHLAKMFLFEPVKLVIKWIILPWSNIHVCTGLACKCRYAARQVNKSLTIVWARKKDVSKIDSPLCIRYCFQSQYRTLWSSWTWIISLEMQTPAYTCITGIHMAENEIIIKQ